MEALSVGCVPICSNVGGIPDVVESGINGFLSSSSSEEDYYNAMLEYFAKSEEEIQILKNTCNASLENYNIINTAKSYITLYNFY